MLQITNQVLKKWTLQENKKIWKQDTNLAIWTTKKEWVVKAPSVDKGEITSTIFQLLNYQYYWTNKIFVPNTLLDIDKQAEKILEEIVNFIKNDNFKKTIPDEFVDFTIQTVYWTLQTKTLDTKEIMQYIEASLEEESPNYWKAVNPKLLEENKTKKLAEIYKKALAIKIYWPKQLSTANDKDIFTKDLGNDYTDNYSIVWLKLNWQLVTKNLKYIKINNQERKVLEILWNRAIHSYLYVYPRYAKVKYLLDYEKSLKPWQYFSNLRPKITTYPIASIFLYYQVLSYLYSLSLDSWLENIALWEKQIAVKTLFDTIIKNLIIELFLWLDTMIFNVSKYNKFLTNRKSQAYYTKNGIELKEITYRKILLEVIKELILNNTFSKWNAYKTEKGNNPNKTTRKEYSKVWQEENLRVNNQTKEIISKLLWTIKDKEIVAFIKSFKKMEIDERTNTEQLDTFFTVYYKVLKYLEEEILSNKWYTINDLTRLVMLKVRKLWQYRWATWIYFPEHNILAVQVHTWKSLVHETGHFIHFLLAGKKVLEKELNWEKPSSDDIKEKNMKKAILNTMFNNKELVEKYPTLSLYTYILTNLNDVLLDYDSSTGRFTHKERKEWVYYINMLAKNIYNYLSKYDNVYHTNLDLLDKLNREYLQNLRDIYTEIKETFKWKSEYKIYWWTSPEIFARLFDYTITDKLRDNSVISKEQLDLVLKDWLENPKDNILWELDKLVVDILKKSLWKDKEELYNEFINFIKHEL